jgi:hypothetical protein
VDRPNRVQLVEGGGCGVTSNNETKGFLQYGGKRCPCRDDGGGEIARFLRALNQRDYACNIDPPVSSYAIMRRAGPYRGENSGPGKDVRGELDPTPGIRERARPNCDMPATDLGVLPLRFLSCRLRNLSGHPLASNIRWNIKTGWRPGPNSSRSKHRHCVPDTRNDRPTRPSPRWRQDPRVGKSRSGSPGP